MNNETNTLHCVNYCEKCNSNMEILHTVNNAPHPIPVNKTTPNGLKIISKDKNYVVECKCSKCGERYKVYVTRYKYERNN